MDLGENKVAEHASQAFNSYSERLYLFMSCLKALKNFHDNNLIHRDIKSNNFLSNKTEKDHTQSTKLIDLGMLINLNKAKAIDQTTKRTGNIKTEFDMDFYKSKRFQFQDFNCPWNSPEVDKKNLGNWFSKA